MINWMAPFGTELTILALFCVLATAHPRLQSLPLVWMLLPYVLSLVGFALEVVDKPERRDGIAQSILLQFVFIAFLQWVVHINVRNDKTKD